MSGWALYVENHQFIGFLIMLALMDVLSFIVILVGLYINSLYYCYCY